MALDQDMLIFAAAKELTINRFCAVLNYTFGIIQ